MEVVNLAEKVGRFTDCWSPGSPGALGDLVEVVLLEPKTTLNTGNEVSERTVAELDRS